MVAESLRCFVVSLFFFFFGGGWWGVGWGSKKFLSGKNMSKILVKTSKQDDFFDGRRKVRKLRFPFKVRNPIFKVRNPIFKVRNPIFSLFFEGKKPQPLKNKAQISNQNKGESFGLVLGIHTSAGKLFHQPL